MVWKEARVGLSVVFMEHDRVCSDVVLIQDAASKGMGLIKAAVDLHEKGCRVIDILVLVDGGQGAQEYVPRAVEELTGFRPTFTALTTLTGLRACRDRTASPATPTGEGAE